MSTAEQDQTIKALRAALEVSPDNLPLRRHLAETLLSAGQADQAQVEYQEALRQAPDDESLKLGLADVFYRQGKDSHALVIVEDLVKLADPPWQARILYARLLLRAGNVERAVWQYKQAVDSEPEARDVALEAHLGVGQATDPHAEIVDGRVRAGRDEDPEASDTVIERPTITFDEVGGMEELKDEIRMKIIHPLAHPELYETYGKSLGGGILMYGPPGCGKTYLARATAGEVQASFLSVGLHEVMDMWLGASERNLHEVFEKAREHRPCVLFFDEVDALGASRSDMRQSAGRQVINQFLSELDGVQSSNEGVLVLAATNAPWHIDSAFRRPGRFDRVIFVPPPDAVARAEILRVLLRGKPMADVDFEAIARKTAEFSGADLKAIVDVAVEGKLQEAIRTGVPGPLTSRDLRGAAKRLKPTTREWFANARNYALYSNQGGIYDDVLRYLRIS